MKINLKGGAGLVITLAASALVALVLVKNRAPLEHVALEMPSRVAKVSGEISHLHPNLKAGEKVTLKVIALPQLEAVQFIETFDAFGDDSQIQLLRHDDDVFPPCPSADARS